MKTHATLLGLASAAALACAMTATAPAASHANSTRPRYCNRNPISNTDPGSGTNAATLGIRTKVHSNTPNMSAPPVSGNTPANTNASNINSANPGVHAKDDPCVVTRRRRHHPA
jgi:hypothetical protein